MRSRRGVLCDVAQDVGELERQPQLDRVVARARVVVAEDLDRGEPDRRGDALAVDAQLGKGRVAPRGQVHPAARDDVLERPARDREARDRLRELAPQLGLGRAGVGLVELGRPAREARLPLAVGLVDAVVHDPAEGVERVDRAALRLGQDQERVVEAGPALPREARRRARAHAGRQRQARQASAALSSEAVVRPPLEDVPAHGLDAVQDRGPAEPGEPHLVAQLAADLVAERAALVEQRAAAGDQLRHQAAPAVAHAAAREVEARDTVPPLQLLRHVHAASRVVDRGVLPVVRELEPGADRVGERRQRGVLLLEDVEHEPPHGIGRAAAIVDQLLPGGIAALDGVLLERGEEVEQQLFRDLELANGLGERHEDRPFGLAAVGGLEQRLPLLELLLAHALVDRLVGEVVRGARERVDRVHVGPPGARHEEPHGKVLVVRLGARLAVGERLLECGGGHRGDDSVIRQ